MPKSVRSRYKRKRNNSLFQILSVRRLGVLAAILVGVVLVPSLTVHAASLSSASVAISDPRPSTLSANYVFTASSVTTGAPGTIKCMKALFTDTAAGSTVPAGMNTNASTLDTPGTTYVPTPGAWTVNHPANGTVTITNAAGEIPASAAARKLSLNAITNSSVADTKLFLKFSTYNNTDCTSSPIDNGMVLFILTNGSTLSLNVDPTLTFTVNSVSAGQSCNGVTSTQPSTSTTIPFGTVTTAANSIVCQDLTASTNATNGYTVYARYLNAPVNALAQSIAPTSGSNTAPAAFPASGNEAYGYTTNDFTLGTGTAGRFNSNLWAAMTTANSEVGYEPAGVNLTTYRVGHQVGVSTLTKPGTYTTTVIYTCTPIY